MNLSYVTYKSTDPQTSAFCGGFVSYDLKTQRAKIKD